MSSNPEDIKLLTLAIATKARSGAKSAAALRDTTGRTYVGIPVTAGEFSVDALLAVLIVAKASQITGIEAVVVVGEIPTAGSISIIRAVSATGQIFSVTAENELNLL
jgi:hypothetical protein